MKHDQTFDGRCNCGAVQYRMTSQPMIVHACHCTWCRRETGGPFAWNAMIEAERVTLRAGRPEVVDTPTESGIGQKVWRCPQCRVALWSNYGGSDDTVRFVRVGTLEEPARLPPDVHIFRRSKQPWLTLSEGARAVDVYYDPADVWSADSLARRALLEGRQAPE